MRHVATLALLLGSSSLAFADAPGDDESDYYGPSSVQPAAQAPQYSTPYAAPPPCSYAATGIDVMANRWAIGLGVGSASFAPESNPDAQTNFSVAELSLRYRATYHLELELALTGGREVLEDGSEGQQAMGGGTLGLRYRFSPSQRWNWWLMGGLGQTTVAAHDSSKEEREQLAKPHAQLGVGLERRFQRFAIQAEFRFTAMGDRGDEAMATPTGRPPQTDAGGGVKTDPQNPEPTMNPPPKPVDGTLYAPEKQQGGQFTLGLSYYF